MVRLCLALLTGLAAACALPPQLAREPAVAHWPQFRGPQASGVADGQPLPRTWDATTGEGIRWKTPVPGLSHASPVVCGDRVFVATAVASGMLPELKVGLYGAGDSAQDMVEHEFRLLCLDRHDGTVLWSRTAARGVPRFARHTKATHANSTPATDGDAVVVLFGSEGLFCYDTDGALRWHRDLGPLDVGPHNALDLHWGYASSPVIADGTVVVQADVKQDPFLAAFDLATGEPRWRVARDDVPGWCTPTVVPGDDGGVVLVNGCKHIGAYRLADGAEVWRMAGGGGIPVPAPVAADGLAYFTSNHQPLVASHPRKPVFAVRMSARGDLGVPDPDAPGEHLAWVATRLGTYMQTPLVYRGIAWLCQDNGVVAALDAATGEQLYRERLGDGSTGFSASPVAGDGVVYFTSEQGDVFVVDAAREFALLGQNQLGEICMATPAVVDGTLLFRTRGQVVCVAAR